MKLSLVRTLVAHR